MFDYSVLTVDVDDLLLASDINLEKALNLFTFFAVQEKAKTQKIFPEKVESLKMTICQRMTKAFDDKEFECATFPDKEFYMELPDDTGYLFGAATASFTDVVCWARKAGIPISDDFYTRVFPEEKVVKDKAKKKSAKVKKSQDPEQLSAIEKRELGRLRIEKVKWDKSISAAVAAGIYCAGLPKGTKVKKDEIIDFICKAGHEDLPLSTIGKIRDALPEEIKNQGGRPKGSKNVIEN